MFHIFSTWLYSHTKEAAPTGADNTGFRPCRLIVKGAIFGLFPVLLTGCLSTSIKMPDTVRSQVKTLRVVALESPPLEVVPDLLESRMPVYAHYDNMALPLFADSKVYRLPGGLLIAGRVGEGDSVEIADVADTERVGGQSADWLPTEVLLQEAIVQLSAAQLQAKPERSLRPLPLTAAELDADLVRWRDAIAQWYGQGPAANNDRTEDVDAVLELGVGQYKIYAGQISLQILLKLIDPKSGKVIARVDEKSTAYAAPIPALLDQEGAKFKSLLRQRAANLVARGFHDIGLTSQ